MGLTSPHHFWRSFFAFVFILQGVLAFGLPTHNTYEIIARIIIILIGIMFTFSFRRREFALYLLAGSMSFVVFWLAFALIQIFQNQNDPLYGVHRFYIVYWFALIILHLKAIQDVREGR